MKKIFLLFVVFLCNTVILSAGNNTVNESLTSSQVQIDPWTREAGLQYNMAILAKVYKDGVLFQPSGSLLGIFKDNKCWGYAGLGNSPVGLLFNVTIGYNTTSATGFNYQFYDPTTSKIYPVVETVNFTNGVPVGAINAPVTLNIQTYPWNKEPGLQYNMPILAKVYKDGVLFQPTGSLLGIFKDGKCWGYAGLGNSPVGPLYNVTIGYNSASASGFNYQFYDATTDKSYSVVETVNFANSVPVGAINAPISLNIQNAVVTELNTPKTEQINVYPNPIESVFYITLNTESTNNAIVKLYNLQGLLVKTVFCGSVNGQKIISVQRDNNLSNGLYLLKAQIGGKQFIQKIVIK